MSGHRCSLGCYTANGKKICGNDYIPQVPALHEVVDRVPVSSDMSKLIVDIDSDNDKLIELKAELMKQLELSAKQREELMKIEQMASHTSQQIYAVMERIAKAKSDLFELLKAENIHKQALADDLGRME